MDSVDTDGVATFQTCMSLALCFLSVFTISVCCNLSARSCAALVRSRHQPAPSATRAVNHSTSRIVKRNMGKAFSSKASPRGTEQRASPRRPHQPGLQGRAPTPAAPRPAGSAACGRGIARRVTPQRSGQRRKERLRFRLSFPGSRY